MVSGSVGMRSAVVCECRVALSLALVLCFPVGVGYVAGSGVLERVLSELCHVNVWHLLTNVIALWELRPLWREALCGMVAALVCTWLPSCVEGVTMGASGWLLVVVGMRWGVAVWDKGWRSWRNARRFAVCVALPVLCLSFFQCVNTPLHVWCLLCGVLLYELCARLVKKR